MKVWQLGPRSDYRIKAGHPWVFSNELSQSPKGIEPGELIELRDSHGKFIAYGYGNPKSLIAFRALSRNPQEKDAGEASGVVHRLKRAHDWRHELGLTPQSYRLCFGEADQLPGLIIDRYLFTRDLGQVFVCQAHTAGAEQWIRDGKVLEILESHTHSVETSSGVPWERTSVLIKNTPSARELEGLQKQPPDIKKLVPGHELGNAQILVRIGGQSFHFYCDLIQGQKTGFFLDQSSNIGKVLGQLQRQVVHKSTAASIRILDLCSYVGQWGLALSEFYLDQGFQVSCVCVDASQKALDFAKKNTDSRLRLETVCGDIPHVLESLPNDQGFDVVVCDPPALIKNRKSFPQGKQAYVQWNTHAMRLLKAGGFLVSCSCSSLLSETDFQEVLCKAQRRAEADIQWMDRGIQAPDHPISMAFPEGQYLKMWIGKKSL